jgi:fatty acid-binding protein DegV
VSRSRTRSRALARIVQEVEDGAAGRPVHVGVFHADAEEDAELVADRIEESVKVVERLVVPVTPVIGAHTGPGLVGAAFYAE